MPEILVFALVPALVDWWAVYSNRPSVESIAKPLVMVVLFIGVAAAGFTGTMLCVAIALVFSLLGDIALLPRSDKFLLGLGSFFVGHVFYIAAFLTVLEDAVSIRALAGLACAGAVAWVVGRRIVSSVDRSEPSLRHPVVAYILVLGSMLAVGIAGGGWVGALGAILFAASDAILGWNRFVKELQHGRLLTHVSYHLGQGLIAWWVIGL